MKEHRSKVLFSSLQDLSVWTMVLDPLFRNIESEFLMVDPRNWYFIINFEQSFIDTKCFKITALRAKILII